MTSAVVITGMGAIASIGATAAAVMEGIAGGRRGIDKIRSFNTTHFPQTTAAEVPGIALEPGVEKKRVLLEKAAQDLVAGNSLLTSVAPEDRIFVLGSGVDYLDWESYLAAGAWHNWSAHIKNSHAVAADFAARYGFCGGVHVNVSACVASNQAIGLGYRLLQKQTGKIVVAGGVDSMLDPLGYIGFYKLGALSTWSGEASESCRPFDRRRSGIVLGEGAALFQLQNKADADPAQVLAEIAGYGTSMDAYLITDPRPDGSGLARAAQAAMDDAEITPAEVDCVHLHGTGTPKNAIAEAKALQLLFGERAADVPVFGFKGQIGHLIGACGAVELLAVLYSLLRQAVPATVNFTEPDPAAPLRVIAGGALSTEIRYVLKLNAAFGGQNSALVLKRAAYG